MNDLRQYEGQIVKYIAKELSETEQAEFEQMLATDKALRREVRERSMIQAALHISDDLDALHMSEADLTAYVQSKDSMDSEALQRVKKHIGECTVCSQFAEDATEVWALANTITPESLVESASVRPHGTQEVNPFIEFLKKLFVVPVPIRPAYGLIALILIAMPVFRSYITDDSTVRTATFELVESEVRGTATTNEIGLSGNLEIIYFEFALPVRQDRLYDIKLIDSLSNTIHAQYNVPPADVFSMKLFATEVYPGTFEVNVIERDNAGIQTEHFILSIQVTTGN